MRLTFCAACGAIEDQHHHLVIRSEGRKRFDDERNLITLAIPAIRYCTSGSSTASIAPANALKRVRLPQAAGAANHP